MSPEIRSVRVTVNIWLGERCNDVGVTIKVVIRELVIVTGTGSGRCMA